MIPHRFHLDPVFVDDELARTQKILQHYRNLYENSHIKNIMIHRLISIKEQELKHLEFIKKSYDRDPQSTV